MVQEPTGFTAPASATKGGPRGSYNHTALKPEMDGSPGLLPEFRKGGKVDSRKTDGEGGQEGPVYMGSQVSWTFGSKKKSAKVFRSEVEPCLQSHSLP